MRQFPSGAFRDTDDHKVDWTQVLDPRVLKAFGRYMQRHSRLPDGSRRSLGNWKRGMPREAYLASLLRHTVELWTAHETGRSSARCLEAAMAVWFNVQGYAFELLRTEGQT